MHCLDARLLEMAKSQEEAAIGSMEWMLTSRDSADINDFPWRIIENSSF